MSNNYLKNITSTKEIIANIQFLQVNEEQLRRKLLSSSNDDRLQILAEINKLSQIRITFYNQLDKKYTELKNKNLDLTKENAETLIITDIIENKLDENKKKLEKANIDNENKKRLIQVNMYYSTKYREWNKVMKLIIFICIPLLIVSILKKKELIPNKISIGLLFGIFVFGGIYILYRVADLLIRDNFNFNEYKMPMNIDKDELDFNKYENLIDSANELQDTNNYCIGNKCCSIGTTYDYDLHKCMSNITDIDDK
jgi:hypothetical protein